ncbi:MAG: ABC transporter permease [Candidatus Pacearchaeota archaeon]
MIVDYFKLSLKNLKNRRLRSFLTVLGIFIGIAAVVALISLGQGLQSSIAEQFSILGSNTLTITAKGSSARLPGAGVAVPLTEKDKGVVSKVRGVDIVIGRLLRPVKFEFKDEIQYNYVLSLPDDSRERQESIKDSNVELAQGKLFDPNRHGEIIIGSDFGEHVLNKKIKLREEIKIQGRSFRVVGILGKTKNPQIDRIAIMSESALRDLLNISDEYDFLSARVKEGEDIEEVKQNIEKALRKSRNVKEGKEDFEVETAEQIIGAFQNILSIVQGILVGIAAIALVVGGIGIMNTMYTSVLERTKEIGIMKSIGAKNSDILLIFLIEAGFLGLIGGFIGVILGIGIGKIAELFLMQLTGAIRIVTPVWLIVGALIFSFVVGSLAGTLPAVRASRLKPVEALRYE